MKHISTLSIIISLSINLFSQITFNHREHFGFPNAVLSSILPTDSGFYATGIIVDSIAPFPIKASIAEFDELGNLIWLKSYTKPNVYIQTWQPTLNEKSDSSFIVSGYQTSGEGFSAIIINFNHKGDTLSSHTYLSPYFPEKDFISPIDMYLTNDDEFIIVSNVTNPNVPFSHSDIAVLKVDNDFNQIWHKTFDTGYRNQCKNVLVKPNGNIIIGGWSTNYEVISSHFLSQTHILVLDSLGNQIDTYFSPPQEQRGPAKAMLLEEDGSLIVASATAWEWKFVNGAPGDSIGVLMWSPVLFKLDENMVKVWETSVSNGFETPNHQLKRIVKSTDGEGYVAAGDLMFPKPDTTDIRGWIVKVSNEGDSLWARSLRYLENRANMHLVYDLKTCPDGGYVMCGEAKNLQGGAPKPTQQAWLVKVDEHGCLVPGCHLIDDVSEVGKIKFELKTFPNPSSDYLNIFFRNHSSKETFTFRILDIHGKIWKTFQSSLPEETIMVWVNDFPSGTYFIQVCQKEQVLKTQKVIIQN